jgi:hypothetical protein
MTEGNIHQENATRPYDGPAPAERLRQAKEDALARRANPAPSPPTSYFELAQVQADLEVAADPRLSKAKDPVHSQKVLVAPAWSHDPTGIEPPTGEVIDALPDMTRVER